MERTDRSHAPFVTLFLGGDVMTGRGVDQVLPHPGDPSIPEAGTRSAEAYVDLAERVNGPIPRPVDFAYIWGDALDELAHARPDARIVNLETSVTRSDDYWRGKGINYRMHPDNAPCLAAARIDCAVLANNHVLDYGVSGLLETLETLLRVGVRTAGAGRALADARAPAIIDIAGRARVVVFAFGTESSGIPPTWAATERRSGVHLLNDLSPATVTRIGAMIERARQPRDIVVVSLHWGSNWGFDVPDEHVRFAHGLVEAGVDLVHGHSSHHVRAIEVFAGKLILYGCGDLLDDYEGIPGYEEFRDDLSLLYLPTVDPATGRLTDLRLVPMQTRRFRVSRAAAADARWLLDTLNRVSRPFGFRLELREDRRRALCPVTREGRRRRA